MAARKQTAVDPVASLEQQLNQLKAQLTKAQGHLSELEKAKRSMDSEMLSLRARQHEVQGELSEALRTKEVHMLVFLIISCD